MTTPTGSPEVSLPDNVRTAVDRPEAGQPRIVETGDRRWFALEWGRAQDPPVLLIHGVTSDSGTFWRVGPALAASGRHVLAVDLPGHGRTGDWRGRERFLETAQDVVAFASAAGIVQSDLAVVGHSWGALVTASLPAAGLRPRVLVLIDPPALTRPQLVAMTLDPEEQPIAGPAAAAERVAMLRRAHPDWSEGDVQAKVDGLLRCDREAVLGIILGNGAMDAGVGALGQPSAQGVPTWYICGESSAGGLIPESHLPACVGRAGRDHVITIGGAGHSPQRTHIEPTVAAILRALA